MACNWEYDWMTDEPQTGGDPEDHPPFDADAVPSDDTPRAPEPMHGRWA